MAIRTGFSLSMQYLCCPPPFSLAVSSLVLPFERCRLVLNAPFTKYLTLTICGEATDYCIIHIYKFSPAVAILLVQYTFIYLHFLLTKRHTHTDTKGMKKFNLNK